MALAAAPVRQTAHAAETARETRLQRPLWSRTDTLVAALLAAAACAASWQGARRLPSAITVHRFFIDEWFEADSPRVFSDMVNTMGPHNATSQHPLFPLAAACPVRVLERCGLSPLEAVRGVIAGVAGLWLAALFALLRWLGCRRLDAALFSILGAVSASAICWFVVPETWAFGSVTILLALGVAARSMTRAVPVGWHVLASAATLSMTVTNWMVGLLATVVQFPWRRAAQITVNAFVVVVALWAVQMRLFPTSRFFIRPQVNTSWVLQPESAEPLRVLGAFVFHPMVMPAVDETGQRDRPWARLTVQDSLPGSGGVWGAVGAALWAILLGLGAWGLARSRPRRQMALVIGLALAGQLGLHLVYGAEETFLYSLHWLPLLIAVAACSVLTPARRPALVMAGALAVCALVNNTAQWRKAARFVRHYATEAQAVRTAMAQRPQDPWPRRLGHIVLAVPGSDAREKAYHEPGGSFSPRVGSFGVSVWIANPDGTLRATSDTMPLALIRQRFERPGAGSAPAVVTESIYYQARWAANRRGEWALEFQPHILPETTPVLVVRSVGPAGGPIRSLAWDGQRLLINSRYTVTVAPQPVAVQVGEEGARGWISDRSGATTWRGQGGWGYARLELAGGQAYRLAIQDTAVSAESEDGVPAAWSTIDVDLPDGRFVESLRAQVDHLLMGLVGRQTRPGEPMSDSRPTLREGAYVVVALAEAGELAAARALSADLAEHDFLGGREPDADGPGLSLWALEEVASRLHDARFDEKLWPPLRRKAEMILAMRSADRPIHQPATGPAAIERRDDAGLPVVCEQAHEGLIIPQGDDRKRRLFINAVSHRGLLHAAALAERVGRPDDAARWREAAAALQRAWSAAFRRQRSRDEWTYTSGLWPTGIAADDASAFAQGLEARWSTLRNAQGELVWEDGTPYLPARPSFEIAEAHQWLLAQRPDRAWAVLSWFWDHQSSPGLYTWWEGKEVAFESLGQFQPRWEAVRGWVDRPQATPHYGTAAEMLLLQLDMLVAVDESGDEPVLVIGAGIPSPWRDRPMSVRGVSTRIGDVDWMWQEGRMRVTVRGRRVPVRLGPAFPPETPVQVEHQP